MVLGALFGPPEMMRHAIGFGVTSMSVGGFGGWREWDPYPSDLNNLTSLSVAHEDVFAPTLHAPPVSRS